MRRVILPCLAAIALLAGCGGKGSGDTTTTTAPPAPTIPTTTAVAAPTVTSASDLAACNEVAANLRVVSQMIQNNEKIITSSLHPKDLAKNLVVTRAVLVYAAKVMRLTDVPPSLEKARGQFVSGLNDLAEDYKKARPYAAKNDLAAASAVMQDGPAFQKIQVSTQRIQKTCNA